MAEENSEPRKQGVLRRVIVISIWLLLIASTFFACEADRSRLKSTIAFQKQEPFTLWQDQVTLISVTLTTPGPVERVEFSPPTKTFEGFDLPVGLLGSDPGQLGNGKPFELVNDGTTLRVFAEIDHPEPPDQAELVVWRPDNTGSRYRVVVKRTYYQTLKSLLSGFMKASKETQEREEKRREEMEKYKSKS